MLNASYIYGNSLDMSIAELNKIKLSPLKQTIIVTENNSNKSAIKKTRKPEEVKVV
jgi:hypothetical protein